MPAHRTEKFRERAAIISPGLIVIDLVIASLCPPAGDTITRGVNITGCSLPALYLRSFASPALTNRLVRGRSVKSRFLDLFSATVPQPPEFCKAIPRGITAC